MNLKTHNIISGIITSAIMTAVVSFTLTVLNVKPFNVWSWYKSLLVAFTLVFAISFFLPKMVKKFLTKIISPKEIRKTKIETRR